MKVKTTRAISTLFSGTWKPYEWWIQYAETTCYLVAVFSPIYLMELALRDLFHRAVQLSHLC